MGRFAETGKQATVLVTGDVVHDIRYPAPLASTFTPMPAMVSRRAGGAFSLAELVRIAGGDIVTTLGPDSYLDLSLARADAAQEVTLWEQVERTPGSKDRVWRVQRTLAFEAGPGAGPIAKIAGEPRSAPDPDLVILDDLDLGFRNSPEQWPDAMHDARAETRFVLKTRSPLGQGALWRELIAKHADRLTVVVSVEALRARQAPIARALSWDRAIEDLDRELTQGASARDLARAQRVVVAFGGSGIAVYQQGSQGLKPQRWIFHPEELESASPGQMLDATSIITAALTRHLVDPGDFPLFVALGRALAAARASYEHGGGPVTGETLEQQLQQFARFDPYPAIGKLLHASTVGPGATPRDRLPERVYRAAVPRPAPDAETGISSDLLQYMTGTGYEYVFTTAMRVVMEGVERTLDSVPKVRYGGYLSVGREEIEQTNEVRRLLLSYEANPQDRRPFSLAVFGPPGSGKSFAIKELGKSIFGGRNEVLEFNLTQFNARDDLLAAFDRVRDAGIQGKIPLVFWDEFDANALTWLAEFLVPMQDSRFVVGGVEHPFGKAVFVFAGGTFPTFDTFDQSLDISEAGQQFKRKKGPDFVSRLRGYINIKGPNPVPAQTGHATPAAARDVAHLLRRAILLRSALQRFQPHLIDQASKVAAISPAVARAFLRVEAFRHGARSLEAIIGMSSLSSAREFGASELPSPDLLKLHVTPDFIGLVHDGAVTSAIDDILAEAFHEAWRGERLRTGWQYGPTRDDDRRIHPLLAEYGQLAERDKERNRHTARLTVAKLHQIGYDVAPRAGRHGTSDGPTPFRADERRRLMEMEHDIWLRDHEAHGYAFAEVTNEDVLLHRDMTDYARQSDEDRELSGTMVDVVPDVLWNHGYVLIEKSRDAARVRVGVTGHRALTDLEPIRAGIRTAIAHIQSEYPARPITCMSALAEGADRLVAEAVLSIPDADLIAVLPYEQARYATDFGEEGSPSRLHFEALLARASERIVLPSTASREDGYEQAGAWIVEQCDLLLALWDGNGAHGKAGTAEIVARARERQIPVIIVQTGNRVPGTNQPTTLGPEQGSVRMG